MKALILGGVAPHIELIRNLKHRGYETLLADYLDAPPAKDYADRFYQISTLDKEAVFELAQKEAVDLIITVCVDHANVTMCYVGEKLGLPLPYSYDTSIAMTDKGVMKQRMADYGIPTSGFYVLDKPALTLEGNLRYPVVVKPVDNNGSKGIRKAENDEELAKFSADALNFSRKKEIIVEEFCGGVEIQVDCVVSGGKTQVLMTRRKNEIQRAKGLSLQSFGSVVPAELSDNCVGQISRISSLIAKAFHLEHTFFFYQAKVDGDKVSVLEGSPRIGGGLSYKLLNYYTGIDVIDLSTDLYFGNAPVPVPDEDKSHRMMATVILYASNGTFDHVTGVDELLRNGVILEYDPIAEKGRVLGDSMDSRNRIGALIFEASTKEELRGKIETVINSIGVIGADGRQLLSRSIYDLNSLNI